LNLFQPLPDVPPTVATEPVSTLRKNRQRATCQPPRFPAPGGAPVVRGELRRVGADDLGDLTDRVGLDAADVLGALGRVLGVLVEQRLLHRLELGAGRGGCWRR
jgi:hypothetical protein